MQFKVPCVAGVDAAFGPARLVAALAIFFVAHLRAADAQVWISTATSGTALWSDPANWLGGSVPTSGTGTTLEFFTDTTTPLSSGTNTADNDLGGFTLNSLTLNGLSPAVTGTTTVRLTGNDLTFAGLAPSLTLNGRSATGVLAYNVANNIAFNANTSISGNGNASLILSGQLSGTGTLSKTGASTLQLNGDSSSTFSGDLVLGGGGITVNGGLGGKLSSDQSIVFAGGGTFTYASNNVTSTGTVGIIEFSSGVGGVAQSRGSAGTGTLIVSAVSVAQGASGVFAYSGGGSPGSGTIIRIANQSVGYLPAGLSYLTAPVYYTSGSGTAGSVGGVTYGTTPNSAAISGTQTTLGANTNKHLQYAATAVASQVLTGTIGGTQVTVANPANFSVGGIVTGGVPAFTYVTAISGSTLTLSKALTALNPSATAYTGVSAQTTDSIASLRFSGNGGSILLAASQTLTNSTGGLYATGNNSLSGQLIAGGSGITTGGTTSLYYWQDGANGGMSIQTPILETTTGGLVVSGRGAVGSSVLELAAANTFTGGVWLNAGRARAAFAETPGVSGPLGASGTISFRGGTLQYSAANTFDYSSRFSTEAGQLFSVDTNSQSVTWAANLTSAGGTLTKVGVGNLTLTGSNGFAGVTVTGGLIIVGNANALGTGTVTLGGGGLAADGSPRTVTNPMAFADSVALQTVTAAPLNLTGPVSLPSTSGIVVPTGAANPPEISGVISGPSTALVLGNGTNLILSGNNSGWTPASFSVNNGGITVGHPNALGSGSATYTTTNGGTLVVNADLTGANSRMNRFVLAGTLTLSGSQGLTVLGSLTASAANRTLTNNILPSNLLTFAGPVLLRNGTDTTARVISFGGTGNTTISGTIANGGVSGSASILKAAAGILRLTAANTYTGTTGISAGILAIGSTDSLPGWNTAGRYSVAAGATLAVGDAVTESDFNTIRTAGNFVANAGIGFDVGAGGRTYSGTPIANTAAGLLNLTKVGSGTLAMSVANTYTGTTTVREGTLRLELAGALPANSAISLGSTGLGSGSLDLAVSATTSGAVTLSGSSSAIFGAGTLTASSYVINNTSGTASASAVLAGAGGLTKSNNGTLLLMAANAYRGATAVQGGTLEFASIADSGTANSSALGAPAAGASATIALGSGTNSATLRYVGTGDTSNRVINLAGTTGGITVDAAGSGALVLTAATTAAAGIKTFTLTGTSTATNVIGAIAGADVSVNKTGPGLWRFAGASSFGGRLTVSEGTIVVASAVGSGNSPFGAATGDASLPIIGSSAANLTGTVALLADNVTIARGFAVAALGAGSSQAVVLGNAGSGTATFAGGHSIRLGRDVTLQAAPGGEAIFANAWKDAAGGEETAVAFTVGSAGNDGTVVFGSFLPDAITAVNVSQGTLRLDYLDSNVGDYGPIGFATPVTLGGAGFAGTLEINEAIKELEGLQPVQQPLSRLSFAGLGSTVTGTGTLRLYNSVSGTYNPGTTAAVNVAGTGHTIATAVALDVAATFNVATGGRLGISSVIATGSTGAQSLTKTGLGILELSGANTYSGNTTVSAGTLVVNGLLGNGALSVAAGATLMGSGTIGGAATIFGSHAPGTSPGIETFASSLSYSGGSSQVIWELWGNTTSNSPTAIYDQIVVGGNLDFTGATSLSLDFGGSGVGAVNWSDSFWGTNQSWTLFDVAGTTLGFGNFTLANNPSGWFDSSGQAFSASTRSEGSFSIAQQGNDVSIVYAVPEPGSLALVGIGIAAAAWAARRRR